MRMKLRLFSSVSVLVLSAASVFAGSFGAPPFTNGSPLPTGVNGAYQASLRGENTSGVVGFTYSRGFQTSDATTNFYAIFTEGLVFSGFPQVNIAGSSVSGVFPGNSAGNNQFSNTRVNGFFNGSIDQNSPVYFFKGGGKLDVFFEDPATPGVFFFSFDKDLKLKGMRVTQENPAS